MMDFSVQSGPYRLWARVLLAGDGLVVYVGGGDRPHVGTVAVAEPRQSLADPNRTSATSSVWNRLSHKDEALARPMAERLAARLGVVVVVTAGVHVEGLPPEGIQTFLALADELAGKMELRLGSEELERPSDGDA